MVRTNQGGSVLGFVIVGVVLVALAIGGAYLVRQQRVSPVSTESQPVATQPEEEKQENTEQSQPQAPAPESEQKPAEKPVDTKPQEKAEPAQPSQPAPSSGSTSPTAGSGALPQTGPVEDISALLALSLLSIAVVSYVRSRRVELPL